MFARRAFVNSHPDTGVVRLGPKTMAVLSNLAVRDIETLAHPYTNLAALRETGPLVFERAEGVWIYDVAGKPYIEGLAGLWCTALGYGNEELVEAAAAQMRRLSFGHLFGGRSHDPAIELGEKLKEIAPVPISKVFFCSSGSEANDSQIKLVWYMNNALGRPRKKKIISRIRISRNRWPAPGTLCSIMRATSASEWPRISSRAARAPSQSVATIELDPG